MSTIVCNQLQAEERKVRDFGVRLVIVGLLLIAGAVAYALHVYKSPAQLKTDNFIIETENRRATAGGYEYRTAEQIVASKQKLALWPAGAGVLLLGIGWAAMGARKESSSGRDSE